MKRVLLVLLLLLNVCAAHGGTALVVIRGDSSQAQAVIGIDSDTGASVFRITGVAPELLAHADGFTVLSNAADGSAIVQMSHFDARSVQPSGSVSFSAARLPPIDPWPSARTSAVDSGGQRIAMLEIGEQDVTTAVRTLASGEPQTRFTVPKALWSIAIPIVLWTADDSGIAVIDTVTGSGTMFSLSPGVEPSTFNLYGENRPNPGTFQVLAVRAGALNVLTNNGQLLMATFPALQVDPASWQRVSLWTGARNVGTAALSNNGRFIAIPHFAVGQSAVDGTTNLQIVDLIEPTKQRLLVTQTRFASAAISDSGLSGVVCGLDGAIAIIDARNGRTTATHKATSAAFALGFTEAAAPAPAQRAASAEGMSEAAASQGSVRWIAAAGVAALVPVLRTPSQGSVRRDQAQVRRLRSGAAGVQGFSARLPSAGEGRGRRDALLGQARRLLGDAAGDLRQPGPARPGFLYSDGRALRARHEEVSACLEDAAVAKAVDVDASYGSSIGVSGTPSFFVGRLRNGAILDAVKLSGAQPLAAFESRLDELLRAAN